MSILDRQVLFSSEQAIVASAASTDVIDLGSSSRDVGAGEPVEVLVTVTQSFDALTTMTTTLQTSSTENFSSPVQLTAASLPLASLVAGARFSLTAVPRGVLRYLRLSYTVSGSNPTVGKITAGVGVETVHQDTAIYPDAL